MLTARTGFDLDSKRKANVVSTLLERLNVNENLGVCAKVVVIIRCLLVCVIAIKL